MPKEHPSEGVNNIWVKSFDMVTICAGSPTEKLFPPNLGRTENNIKPHLWFPVLPYIGFWSTESVKIGKAIVTV